MGILVSTGLANYVAGTGSLKAALNLGFIKIYSGTAPTTADNAIGSAGSNTLLCTISNDDTGTGITLGTASANTIPKNSGETWSGTNAATGTASFYRHVGSADDGTLSTTQPRIQGTIGTAGEDMNLSSTSLSASALQTLDYYQITLPLS
jgi:hypothetical protein